MMKTNTFGAIIAICICAFIVLFALSACGVVQPQPQNSGPIDANSHFVVIKGPYLIEGTKAYVIKDTETNILYLGTQTYGGWLSLSPYYNASGMPMKGN